MNAVEIEEAVSELAARPFTRETFPFEFLEAFGNKATTIKSLKKGTTNKSDIGGVLQRNNIHLLTTDPGGTEAGLDELRQSTATKKYKVKFILATDGEMIAAEELATGDVLACKYEKLADHFGFFLLLAGISPVEAIKNNPIDIKATARLNKLYMELLKDNEDWASAERRHDMNHFMARLIFCFFAEDTDIFFGENLFSVTIEQMSKPRSGKGNFSNTHEVMAEIFRAMNTAPRDRDQADLPRWADAFPYVNGGLFSGSAEVPKFSRMARTYLLNAGRLDWKKINPDIFGSMIQAVADEGERGSLGMHYTSVPNILKLLKPLFLDDLYGHLEKADENPRKLLNLRNRMARVRVFDPACGSGNFLVIAYKEMRKLEAEINRRRFEGGAKSIIPLNNFRGIELRDFPVEIARLALIIAEYQCDVLYRGQKEALLEFLPLDANNWITNGNALRLDWLSIFPPTGSGVKLKSEDLFHTPLEQAEIDFANEGGETYICGNPPYKGSKWQTKEQKSDLKAIFEGRTKSWKSLDYVAGWFMKAADYGTHTNASSAFVSTNSICQGQQVPILWPLIFASGHEITFAHTSFKWANLASHNAGVTVVVVGISNHPGKARHLFYDNAEGTSISREVENINAYLVSGANVIVYPRQTHLGGLPEMTRGNSPTDGGSLILEYDEAYTLGLETNERIEFIRPFIGSKELISGSMRYCIWIEDDAVQRALAIPAIKRRVALVRKFRSESKKIATVKAANWAYRFDERKPIPRFPVICVPVISSENRPYLPAGLLLKGTVASNKVFTIAHQETWPLAIICSRLNLTWIATVCARMRTDFSYTNTLGWNTFPVPPLSDINKADLTKCAKDILLAREAHFPATIADLYKPDAMPENLRRAHDKNDETLERIYIGRRFKNDTERLETLFDLYTKMTAKESIS